VFGDVKGTKVFFCGPPKMEEAITGKKTGTLAQLGIEGKALYTF
jgi:cytochrome-b5 reductase